MLGAVVAPSVLKAAMPQAERFSAGEMPPGGYGRNTRGDLDRVRERRNVGTLAEGSDGVEDVGFSSSAARTSASDWSECLDRPMRPAKYSVSTISASVLPSFSGS